MSFRGHSAEKTHQAVARSFTIVLSSPKITSVLGYPFPLACQCYILATTFLTFLVAALNVGDELIRTIGKTKSSALIKGMLKILFDIPEA